MTPRSVCNTLNVSAALITLTLILSSSFLLAGIRVLAAFTNQFV